MEHSKGESASALPGTRAGRQRTLGPDVCPPLSTYLEKSQGDYSQDQLQVSSTSGLSPDLSSPLLHWAEVMAVQSGPASAGRVPHTVSPVHWSFLCYPVPSISTLPSMCLGLSLCLTVLCLLFPGPSLPPGLSVASQCIYGEMPPEGSTMGQGFPVPG